MQPACPSVEAYDAETQRQAAAEFDALPPGAVLRQFVRDYKRLRDQIAVCRARGG